MSIILEHELVFTFVFIKCRGFFFFFFCVLGPTQWSHTELAMYCPATHISTCGYADYNCTDSFWEINWLIDCYVDHVQASTQNCLPAAKQPSDHTCKNLNSILEVPVSHFTQCFAIWATSNNHKVNYLNVDSVETEGFYAARPYTHSSKASLH